MILSTVGYMSPETGTWKIIRCRFRYCGSARKMNWVAGGQKWAHRVLPEVGEKTQGLFVDTELKFPAGSSRVEISYTGISFLPWVKFRYVLQGFDQFWTNAAGRRIATYTNLPPGKYRFKILACNGDGIWNIEGKGVAFEIPPAGLTFHRSSYLGFARAAVVGFGAGWLAKRRRMSGTVKRGEKIG